MGSRHLWPERIGHTELIVILVVIFILSGHRLPSVMRSLGRDVVNFRAERICEPRKWSREPTVSTFQIYVIGIGIFLALALVAAHLFSRR